MADLLNLQNVSLSFGEKRVLHDVSLTLRHGESRVVMGSSGIGKTSLLRLCAGLLKPDSGHIQCHAARISMQFQEPRLLPWLTAAENVNTVLSDKRNTLPEAMEFLTMVGLSEAAELYPAELSGGMAQRVALARALAFRGELYLLDEPFRGLDEALRDDMISLVKEKTKDAGLLLVTHDPEVAQRFDPHPFIFK
ncbi:MAG: ABC transporter ATP-binding protein [Clostridia bacterium]|nr:ABC transporter ATP-binding protein [Clostridia bacterium]